MEVTCGERGPAKNTRSKKSRGDTAQQSQKQIQDTERAKKPRSGAKKSLDLPTSMARNVILIVPQNLLQSPTARSHSLATSVPAQFFGSCFSAAQTQARQALATGAKVADNRKMKKRPKPSIIYHSPASQLPTPITFATPRHPPPPQPFSRFLSVPPSSC